MAARPDPARPARVTQKSCVPRRSSDLPTPASPSLPFDVPRGLILILCVGSAGGSGNRRAGVGDRTRDYRNLRLVFT